MDKNSPDGLNDMCIFHTRWVKIHLMVSTSVVSRVCIFHTRWVKTHLMVSTSVVSRVCISMTSESFIVRLKPHECRSNVMQFSNLCFCSTSVTQHNLTLETIYTGSLLANSHRSDSRKGNSIGIERCFTELIYINANANKNKEQLNSQNTKLIYYTHK